MEALDIRFKLSGGRRIPISIPFGRDFQSHPEASFPTTCCPAVIGSIIDAPEQVATGYARRVSAPREAGDLAVCFCCYFQLNTVQRDRSRAEILGRDGSANQRTAIAVAFFPT